MKKTNFKPHFIYGIIGAISVKRYMSLKENNFEKYFNKIEPPISVTSNELLLILKKTYKDATMKDITDAVDLIDEEYPFNTFLAIKRDKNGIVEWVAMSTGLFMGEIYKIPNIPSREEGQMDEETYRVCQLLKTKIIKSDLLTRTFYCLKSQDIYTLADIVSHKKNDFLRIRHFGSKSQYDLEDFVASKGLYFEMDVTKYGFNENIFFIDKPR